MATRYTALQVGGTATALLTGVAALILGITQMETVQFRNNAPAISGSGANSSQMQYVAWGKRTSLSATGASLSYDVYRWNYPQSLSGSIRRFCLEVTTAASPTTTVDCGVVAAGVAASGTNLFDNQSLTAGLHCVAPSTTEVTIGPFQSIRCGSLTGTGQNLVGQAYVEYNETVID